MQKSDRQLLNDRFKTVYDLLCQHGEIIINHRQKSKTAFAAKLGTKGHIIDNYLSGKREITYAQTKKLCAAFGINEAYMFQGKGDIFQQSSSASGHPPPVNDSNEVSAPTGTASLNNILFTSIGAFASDTIIVDIGEENQYFHIPGLQGNLVAFNINGNSMSPTIHNGDMVICCALENQDELIDNEIYAIATKDSVRVKRLQRVCNDYGQWTHIKLISDNYIDHDPVIVRLEHVRALFKVVRRLTDLQR